MAYAINLLKVIGVGLNQIGWIELRHANLENYDSAARSPLGGSDCQLNQPLLKTFE